MRYTNLRFTYLLTYLHVAVCFQSERYGLRHRLTIRATDGRLLSVYVQVQLHCAVLFTIRIDRHFPRSLHRQQTYSIFFFLMNLYTNPGLRSLGYSTVSRKHFDSIRLTFPNSIVMCMFCACSKGYGLRKLFGRAYGLGRALEV